ncbi:hypothetical protein [Hallerella porci]|uniref:Uncharacterized protein n=1 Tax=Hallerella porci TaxID=1945871 RepID=A0ABX5LQ62_9BACT|nr:hypothetical protein [Hallerella porci]PWL03500.1 hypothetical protein B0H50_10542 [Hallerella porci]
MKKRMTDEEIERIASYYENQTEEEADAELKWAEKNDLVVKGPTPFNEASKILSTKYKAYLKRQEKNKLKIGTNLDVAVVEELKKRVAHLGMPNTMKIIKM